MLPVLVALVIRKVMVREWLNEKREMVDFYLCWQSKHPPTGLGDRPWPCNLF